MIAGRIGVEVADDRVGRAGHHRRVAVRVDGQDRLGRAGADHVLDRPADAAGDVQVRRDPRPGLADLLGVRPPAGRGDDARHADGPAEQGRELVELREALGAPDAAAATDDDARVGQRDRPLLGRDARGDPDAEVAIGQVRGERLDRGRRGARGRGGRRERVRRDRQQADRTVEPGLLEQAAAPALAGDLPRVAGPDLGDSWRPAARPSPSRGVGQDLRAAVAPGARSPTAGDVPLDRAGRGRDRAPRARSRRGGGRRSRGRPRRPRRPADRRSPPPPRPRPRPGAARRWPRRGPRPSVSASLDSRSGAPPSCSTTTRIMRSSPRRRRTSTTRGAASGPSPRISTALSCSTGTRSRILVGRRGRPRSSATRSISFLRARRRPGTDG